MVQIDAPRGVRNMIDVKPILKGDAQCFTAPPEVREEIDVGGDTILCRQDDMIGVVAEGTDISSIKIDLVRTDVELAEGQLLEVPIVDRSVFYQLVNGLTREEILAEKNKRGYVRAEAKKVGHWNADEVAFEPVNWLPQPNAP